MQAQMIDFMNSIADYDREQLFELCIELKQKQLDDAVIIAEFRNASPAMSKDYIRLKEQLADAQKKGDEFEAKYNTVCAQLALKTRQCFGTHNEKLGSLDGIDLNDLQDPLDEDQEPKKVKTDDSDKKKTVTQDAEVRRIFQKLMRLMYGARERKKHDYSRLPHRHTYVLDTDKYDELFGAENWEIAAYHSKELLHRLPVEYYVEVRHVPVIKNRESGKMKSFPMPGVMRSHSSATESVIAYLIYEKAFMGSPVNRISDHMENQGFTLSRQTLSNWLLNYAEERLGIGADFMEQTLQGYHYGQGDESTLEVIHDGRKAGSKSYMWLHTSSELDTVDPIAVFKFELTRGADHLRNFYNDCLLSLTCDAYQAYPLLEKESDGNILITGCFMHVRRRFFLALLLKASGLSEEQTMELLEYKAILLIAEIYHAERLLIDLTPDERKIRRDKDVRPHVDAFFEFCHSVDLSDPLLSEKMKDAISYSLNQEVYLRRFLEDGHIPLDNGYAERIFKRYAMSRRNWLFCNTERGARVLGIIFTIVETARLNGANPLLYLEYLLEKTPEYMDFVDRNRLKELMPWSDEWRSWVEAKSRERMKMWIPPSDPKPDYRPYNKKKEAGPIPDIAAAV